MAYRENLPHSDEHLRASSLHCKVVFCAILWDWHPFSDTCSLRGGDFSFLFEGVTGFLSVHSCFSKTEVPIRKAPKRGPQHSTITWKPSMWRIPSLDAMQSQWLQSHQAAAQKGNGKLKAQGKSRGRISESKWNSTDSLMTAANSVNRRLRQSDYIDTSKDFYALSIYIYFTLSEPAGIILRERELLLMSLLCGCICDDNVWGCNCIHSIYCNNPSIKIHKHIYLYMQIRMKL